MSVPGKRSTGPNEVAIGSVSAAIASRAEKTSRPDCPGSNSPTPFEPATVISTGSEERNSSRCLTRTAMTAAACGSGTSSTA